MYKLFSLVFVWLLAGCAISPEPSPSEELPAWVNNPPELHAVGSSDVNFQGIYMQRLEAINKARSDLAHNLKSYITSQFEIRAKSSNEKFTTKVYDKVNALSEVFLNESYQVDAYIDSKKRLYILLESKKERINSLIGGKNINPDKIELPVLKTVPFDKEKLMQSRCYDPYVLQSLNTQSNLYQNRPVWFFRPNQNGVVGSIGIAEKEEGRNFLEQKSVALSLAKSSLATRQKSQIASEHEALKIVHDDISGKLFETSSILRSETNLDQVVERDIWLDPNSCELYIWVIKK
ncbi:MAG: hypothetical protein Q7U00_10075 [Sulfurimonas sp.]|nr:hypothetical protein [Sulfurimonas sp.]